MSGEQTGSGSNASKAIHEVEIEFAGEKHILQYSLWSFCKLDELTGKNPLVGSSWADMHPKDVLALLWAGLLHEEKPISLEELGKKISLQDIAVIGPKIRDAMGQSMPDAEEEKKTDPEPS